MFTQSMLKNGRPWTVNDTALLDDLTPDEQQAVTRWIRNSLVADENATTVSSYALKHLMTDETGIYVTNNQFKHAMLRCGFKPEHTGALNWVYALHRRSPAFVHAYARNHDYANDILPMTPQDENDTHSFYSWMQKHYGGKNGPGGDLARDMFHDLTWPHENSLEVFRHYFSVIGACSAAWEAFNLCWKEYRREFDAHA